MEVTPWQVKSVSRVGSGQWAVGSGQWQTSRRRHDGWQIRGLTDSLPTAHGPLPAGYCPLPSRQMSGSRGNTPKTSSYLGENGRELYMSLSSEGRDKLRGIIQSYVQGHPDQSPEETSAVAQKIYAKIKAGDQNSSSSSTSSSGDNPSPKSYRGKMSKRGRSIKPVNRSDQQVGKPGRVKHRLTDSLTDSLTH